MFKKTFLILSFIATLVGLALGYDNKENPDCDLKIDKGRRCGYGQSGSPGTYYGYYNDQYCRARYCGKCRRFRYKGCGGNNNRFESNEKCEASCVEKPAPPPYGSPTPAPYEPAPKYTQPAPEPAPYEPAPKYTQPAPEPAPYEPAPTPASYGPTCPDDDPKIIDLQKQIQKKTDELEIYGKRYKSMKNMLKKCKESSYKPPSYSNSSTQKKYGFIKRGYNGGYCKAFNYAGCGGNQNKFDSKRKCQKFCRGYRLPKKCKLRIKKGRPCKPYEAPPY